MAHTHRVIPSEAELDTFIRGAWRYASTANSFVVPAESRQDFVPLFGLTMQALRHGEAYVKLKAEGHPIEALVLARASLEHAVTAQWVYRATDGASRAMKGAQANRKQFFGELANWLNDDELATMVADITVPSVPGMPKFTGRGNLLDTSDEDGILKTAYSMLSASVHVTHSTYTGYFNADDSELGLSVNMDPEDRWRHEHTYFAAIAAMMAAWTLASITEDTPRMTQLDRDSDELRLPTRIRTE
jgi:hypothetical protein